MRKLKKLPIVIMASEELEKISSSVIGKLLQSNKSFALRESKFGKREIILQKKSKYYNY